MTAHATPSNSFNHKHNGKALVPILVGVLVAALIAFMGFKLYTTSDGYLAKQAMLRADDNIMQGNISAAQTDLLFIAQGPTELVTQADTKLKQLVSTQSLSKADVIMAKQVLDNHLNYLENKGISDLPYDYLAWIQPTENIETNLELKYLVFKRLRDVFESKDESLDSQALSFQLLQPLVTRSDQATYLIDLAEYYDLVGEYNKVPELLAPIKDQLGTTKGARLLGQYYADNNNAEQAYELLKPYLDAHLSTYQRISKEYDDILDTLWDDTIAGLNNGDAPAGFFDEYDKADELRQDEMLNEQYYIAREKSVTVTRIDREYQKIKPVLGVVMDLGYAMLQRAHQFEGEEKQQALNDAEELFLSVKNDAEDRDDYNLSLGQVYFWLGKYEQGEERFEHYLSVNDSSVKSLYRLGRILRELGDGDKANALFRQAYDGAEDIEDKQYIAEFVLLTTFDHEQKLIWIERVDLTQLYNQASRHEIRANDFENKGERESAVAEYKLAIEVRDSMQANETEKSSTYFNNQSLAYKNLYELSNDLSYLSTSVEMIDKAVEMEQSDSILVANAADMHLTLLYLDVLDQRLDYASLLRSPRQSDIHVLYGNQAEKQQMIDKALASEHYEKTSQLYRNLLVLAPKSNEAWRELLKLYELFEDDKGMQWLAEQAKNQAATAAIIHASEERDLSVLSDEVKSEKISQNNGYIENWIPEFDYYPETDSINRIMINAIILSLKNSNHALGESGIESTIKKATELNQTFSSQKIQSNLESLLEINAFNVLSQKSDTFNQFAMANNDVSRWLLMDVALLVNKPLRQQALQLPAFNALIDGYHKKAALYERPYLLDVVMLKIAEHQTANTMIDQFKNSQERQHYYQVYGNAMNHNYISHALYMYLYHVVNDNTAQADRELTRAQSLGLDLSAIR
jgi:hypothetical protein